MALSTVSNALQSPASELCISNFDAHVLAVKRPPFFFKFPSSSPRTQSAPRSRSSRTSPTRRPCTYRTHTSQRLFPLTISVDEQPRVFHLLSPSPRDRLTN
ncbi:hypothetical protein Bbelb_373170 [Branchiostoma belcheri]|nr:hypothetical protein Bbelb_373170 [Branchiostoma belcheri]